MGNSPSSRLKANDSGYVKPSKRTLKRAKNTPKLPTCMPKGRRRRRKHKKKTKEISLPLLTQGSVENAHLSSIRCYVGDDGMQSSSSTSPQNMSPVSNSSNSENTKDTLNVTTSFSNESSEINESPNGVVLNSTCVTGLSSSNDDFSNKEVKKHNVSDSPPIPLEDGREDEDDYKHDGVRKGIKSNAQHYCQIGTLDPRNDAKELEMTRPISPLNLFSNDRGLPESPPPITRSLKHEKDINDDTPPLPDATPKLVSDDSELSENAEPLPSTYHNSGDGDQCSLNSESLLSTYSTDLESIGNFSADSSLSDLSLSTSVASLNLKRRKRRMPPQSPQLKNSRVSSSKRRLSGTPKNIRNAAGRPTANNAFETLPRHLIKSALVRHATSTLRDERFVNRRIVKLGPIQAAKIHVSDLLYLHKRDVKDSRRRETLGVEAVVPDSSTFRDGECAMSVTLESFDLFQKCILELCSIRMVDLPLDCELPKKDDAACDNSRPSSAGKIISEVGTIPSSDGGKAIYLLGKCVEGKEWNEEAMLYYRSALFLLLIEVGIREPTLLDESGDCTGFFYVRIANAGVDTYSPIHKDIATILTKMGDVHGKNNEINDALHAYRASQVFWKKYISEKKITSVVECVCVEDMADLDDHAAAVEGLALTHNRIGGVYCSKGDLSSAINSFNEAIQMQLKALGPDHLEVAKTLHNIGVSHRHSKDLDKALDYYNQALRIFELNLGREHLDTVRTLHNIGGVYRRRKEYEKAMECFQDVLKVRRALLGENHPSVSITLVSIAAVLRRSGKAEEANKYYLEAMK